MNKKLVGKVAAVALVVIVAMHFIPVQKSLGFLVVKVPDGNGNMVSSELCVGHTGPEPHYYRFVIGGWGDYSSDKKMLVKDSRAANGDAAEYGCSDPVDLRLYLW